MKKNVLFSLFTFLIVAAPLVDIGSRSVAVWGEPDFPSEEEF